MSNRESDGEGYERTVTRVGHSIEDGDEIEEYVGRANGGRNLNNTKIGARGWLGNPHTLENYTREESIGLFREDFEAKIRGDEEFREAVKELSGKTLGCWCQTLDEDGPACHAEVIAEWADRLAREGDDAC